MRATSILADELVELRISDHKMERSKDKSKVIKKPCSLTQNRSSDSPNSALDPMEIEGKEQESKEADVTVYQSMEVLFSSSCNQR